MSSYLHELLILLFRNRSTSAAELLRGLDVDLPEYDGVCLESSDLGNVRPAEYRADLVLFLMRGSHKVLGVILEVQLACDEDKPYAWPAYIANLRARHRCPVCLLVIAVETTVALWAGRPIDLGPGTRCNPWVVGPSNTPPISDLQAAHENVELAVLSAIENGQSTDIALAARTISAAIVASADVDAERCRLYLDLLMTVLSKRAPRVLKAAMNSLGYEYQSDFARHYIAEGKAEGRVEGRVEIIIQQLTARFGALSQAVQAQIRSAEDAQLHALAERLLAAQTLEEALYPLFGIKQMSTGERP
jgi:hypothetical protein